jgi:hypothetical protein
VTKSHFVLNRLVIENGKIDQAKDGAENDGTPTCADSPPKIRIKTIPASKLVNTKAAIP